MLVRQTEHRSQLQGLTDFIPDGFTPQVCFDECLSYFVLFHSHFTLCVHWVTKRFIRVVNEFEGKLRGKCATDSRVMSSITALACSIQQAVRREAASSFPQNFTCVVRVSPPVGGISRMDGISKGKEILLLTNTFKFVQRPRKRRHAISFCVSIY